MVELVKIVEGPIEGGNKPDHRELKGDKKVEKVLSKPKLREV